MGNIGSLTLLMVDTIFQIIFGLNCSTMFVALEKLVNYIYLS
jgi:hypothetical protein